MYTVSNNNLITLTRGDSFTTPLFINWGTKLTPIRFSLKNHPSFCVYLGVMEPNQPFEEALIKKHYDKDSPMTSAGDLLVSINASDTEYLLPGKYYYEVKLVKEKKGKVITIIPKTEFFILD